MTNSSYPLPLFTTSSTKCFGPYRVKHLLEGLSEHKELHLVVDGQDTGTGNTTEDVGTSTLEERLNSLLGDDLATAVKGSLVLDGLSGGHHHAATDGVEWVRGDTGTSGDGPSKSEGGKEVTLEGTGEENWLDGIVHSEVKTTVDDNSDNGWTESTVKTGNTVRGEGLLVDIGKAVELTLTTLLGGLVIVGKTGTGEIEGVDEEEGGGSSHSTGGEVTGHPLGVTLILLEGEHALVGVAESEVKSLGWEVTDDVGSVSSPEGGDTLLVDGALEALGDTVVLAVKTTHLDHLILSNSLAVVLG